MPVKTEAYKVKIQKENTEKIIKIVKKNRENTTESLIYLKGSKERKEKEFLFNIKEIEEQTKNLKPFEISPDTGKIMGIINKKDKEKELIGYAHSHISTITKDQAEEVLNAEEFRISKKLETEYKYYDTYLQQGKLKTKLTLPSKADFILLKNISALTKQGKLPIEVLKGYVILIMIGNKESKSRCFLYNPDDNKIVEIEFDKDTKKDFEDLQKNM